ncbi:MAG: hypothetical protein JO249_03590 [Acidobacteria bacterium]|nr:hypothetical protein [Acidobacteriota bacterium]
MPLIAKYRLTWRGSIVEPGTVIDALNPNEDRRLFELQRAHSVVFVPEEGSSTDQPSNYTTHIPPMRREFRAHLRRLPVRMQ